MHSSHKQFWTLPGRREILLDLMSPTVGSIRLDARAVSSAAGLIPKEGEVSLVWRDYPSDKSRLPNAIVAHRATLEDLFAWSATYLRGVGPLSSNCRTLLTNDAEFLFDQVGNGLPTEAHSVLVGLILAEVVLLSQFQTRPKDITISACERTVSYLVGRAIAARRPDESIEQLPRRWTDIRQYIPSGTSTAVSEQVGTIGKIVAALFRDKLLSPGFEKDFITRSLSELYHERQLTKRTVVNLGAWLRTDVQDLNPKILELPPQERVSLFDEIVPHIAASVRFSQLERAFAVALIAAICMPGSFQQYDLLHQYAEEVPESLLWFAVIQGLVKGNDILSIGEGLGRRVLREMTRSEDLIDPPISDINLLELEVLSRGVRSTPLRTAVSSQIRVEVQPAIYGVARWRDRESPQPELPLAEKMSVEKPDRVDELLSTLHYAELLAREIKLDVKADHPSATPKKRRRR
jgi:hypothetical protein